MSSKIRIGQLRLSVPRTRAMNPIPAAQTLANSVAQSLAASLSASPLPSSPAQPRAVRSVQVRVPSARSSAADIARAIRKSFEGR